MSRPTVSDPRLPLGSLRANSAERKAIEARRARTGLSMSAYLRAMAINGSIVQRAPLADNELVRALAAIGNNMNQIARVANATGQLDDRLIERLREALDRNQAVIERLIA